MHTTRLVFECVSWLLSTRVSNAKPVVSGAHNIILCVYVGQRRCELPDAWRKKKSKRSVRKIPTNRVGRNVYFKSLCPKSNAKTHCPYLTCDRGNPRPARPRTCWPWSRSPTRCVYRVYTLYYVGYTTIFYVSGSTLKTCSNTCNVTIPCAPCHDLGKCHDFLLRERTRFGKYECKYVKLFKIAHGIRF